MSWQFNLEYGDRVVIPAGVCGLESDQVGTIQSRGFAWPKESKTWQRHVRLDDGRKIQVAEKRMSQCHPVNEWGGGM